jgi:hypothetical protein
MDALNNIDIANTIKRIISIFLFAKATENKERSGTMKSNI